MLEKIRGESKAGPIEMSEDDSNRFYDKMDELLDLYAEHVVAGFPAENLRGLGGYKTDNGFIIKNNKILRSGELDKFTTDDFKKTKRDRNKLLYRFKIESRKEQKTRHRR